MTIEYSYIGEFREGGLADISKGVYYHAPELHAYYVGQCGFVNSKGEWVVPLIYDVADPFVSGLASVRQKADGG